MALLFALFTCCLALCEIRVSAIDLSPCGTDNTVDVVQNKNTTLTCRNIPDDYTVEWLLAFPSGNVPSFVGTCVTVGSCSAFTALGYTASRPQSDTSIMTIDPTRNAAWVRNGRLFCRVSRSANIYNTSCRLDIVYPASVTPVTVQHTAGTWKATGSVTITKVNSSLGRYTCQWYRGTSQTSQPDLLSNQPYTTSEIQGDPDYRTGTCDFTAAILPTSGTYYYRVVITPGGTQRVSGPVTVGAPDTPTISCTPSPWVPTGSQLTCICSISTIGQPPGRLQGVHNGAVVNNGTSGDDSLTMTSVTLTRSDHGTGRAQFACRVAWIQDKQSTTHVAKVAWGPDNVNIPGSRTFDTDSTGSRDLSLSCDATGVNPSASADLTYSWTGGCQGNTGSTCSFQPQPPDDDKMELRCTVTNPYNNNHHEHDTYRLDLNYPPLSAPVIKGYEESQAVYAGDSLSMTCEVHGGKPWVTSVTFACLEDHPDNATDVTESGSVSSSLDVSVSQSDDGITCSCTARWKVAAYYTDSADTTLTVYYSPSTPRITRKDGLPYPYIEGNTARLSCDLQPSRGNPTATLTWSGHEGDETTPPTIPPATLEMTSLGKGDNNRSITCRADNAWTQNTGQDISFVFPLQVYYSPQILMVSQEGNNRCQVIQNTAQCAVIQGERVHFTCSADSNPPPATFQWRKDGSQDGDLDIDPGPDLDIQSADREKHNGNFTCTVTTENLQGTGHSASPLTATDQLTVIVKYSPERISLTFSHVTGNLTLSEGDIVVLACRVDGRPTPDMTLVKDETGSRVHYVKGGVLVVEDRDSWLNYTITSAKCNDTGTYTCTAGNDVGTGPAASGAVFVSCKPRSPSPPPVDVPSVNYVNQSVHLTFNLWALPVPDRYEILYLGPFGNETAVRVSGIVFDVQFIVTGELYNITCDVTVVNVTDSAAGFYQLNVTNTHGNEQLVFQVKYNEVRPYVVPQQDDVAYGAIGGGIAAVIVVAVIIGAVIFIRKRRLRTPALQAPRGSAKQNTSLRVTGNGASVQTSDYEHLRMGDVGDRSPYSTFQPQHRSDRTPDHVYENSPDDSTRTYVNTVSLN